MSKTISLLQQVKIASPCTVSWESMIGDETVRYCGQCKLNVYNLSALTDEEAETLLRERTGRMCGRIYQRHDGTVLTRDCPVGMRAIRRRLARMVGAVAASLLLGAGAFGFRLWLSIGRRIGIGHGSAFDASEHRCGGRKDPPDDQPETERQDRQQ